MPATGARARKLGTTFVFSLLTHVIARFRRTSAVWPAVSSLLACCLEGQRLAGASVISSLPKPPLHSVCHFRRSDVAPQLNQLVGRLHYVGGRRLRYSRCKLDLTANDARA